VTTQDTEKKVNWSDLARVEPDRRKSMMVREHRRLAALPEEERVSEMQAMVEAEYNLPDDLLRDFTESRLRTWLELEPVIADLISSAYEAATLKLSADKAMQRIALVQTLAREFTPEEQEELIKLLPDIFEGIAIGVPVGPPDQKTAEEPEQPKKKWWWPFG
jgi:hypothetical protein